jgi:nucleosome binding factor SPN SPT16 subunit
MYDPDEMDDEQRERQLRKKLNEAFKDFCRKVENVARKNNFTLEFDIPYRDLGFQGNPHKEMVFILPTLNCLVNLTETPFFVVDLSDVDHVHFERVTFMSKAFDVVLINKDFSKQPFRVDMIPNVDKDAIQVSQQYHWFALLFCSKMDTACIIILRLTTDRNILEMLL